MITTICKHEVQGAFLHIELHLKSYGLSRFLPTMRASALYYTYSYCEFIDYAEHFIFTG